MNYVLDDKARKMISKGLEKYKKLMDLFRDIRDVSTDDEFKKKFNAFYVIRYKKENWQPIFYRLFEDVRTGKRKLDFGSVLTALWERDPKHRVASSFVSKMFATIETDRPIVDANVLKKVRGDLPSGVLIDKSGGIKGKGQKKIENAIQVYDDLLKWFADTLRSEEGHDVVQNFDAAFNDYVGIPDAKKYDFWLWALGSEIK